jgi:hypothetical protein
MLIDQLFKELSCLAKLQWSYWSDVAAVERSFEQRQFRLVVNKPLRTLVRSVRIAAHQIHSVHKTCSGRIDKLTSLS